MASDDIQAPWRPRTDKYPIDILPLIELPPKTMSLCSDCRNNASLRKLQTLDIRTTLNFRVRKDPDCACCKLIQRLISTSAAEGKNPWVSFGLKNGNEQHTYANYALLSASQKADSSAFVDITIWPWSTSRVRYELPPEMSALDGPLEADLGNLRRMMVYCSKNHGGSCGASSAPQGQDLKLISCTTRKIEAYTGRQKYAALSYVWGHAGCDDGVDHGDSDKSGRTPQTFEQTIEDALLVTLKMGLDYLWVDRYCIDQDDPGKHVQIRQMDLIYQHSELTIVAAAGDGPSYGLPGISRRRRKKPCYIISDVLLLRFLDSVDIGEVNSLTTSSRWCSRAWTFQEALFSRRALIFTDGGASFCCAKTQLYRGLETRVFRFFRQENLDPTGVDQAFHVNSITGAIGNNLWDIAAHISEYSRRELTYDSDALNGFAGVLRAYESMKPPLHHLWGVPVFPSFALEGQQLVKTDRLTSDGFVRGLSWSLTKASSRRPGFPSWSWAGWRGGVTCPLDWSCDDRWSDSEPVHVALEFDDGRVLQWSEVEKRSYFKDVSYEEVPSVLHLEAWTMDVKLCETVLKEDSWLGLKGTRRLCAEYFGRNGCRYLSCLQVEDERWESTNGTAFVKSQSFMSIILGSLSWVETNMIAIIVVERKGLVERYASFHVGEGRDGQPTTLRDRRRNLEELMLVRRSIRLG